jgi:hypothetical protein
MIFSKADKIPDGLDYDKTVSKLLKLGWLSEIFDVESNKSIYQITDLGYQYYFTICLATGYEQLFNGPKQIMDSESVVNEDMDIFEEGYIIPVRDGQKLTPTGAEYLCVLIDAHDKEIRTGGKNKKTSKSGTVNKIGKYSAMFMRGMQKVSEVAQEYDKQSTIATRKYWVKDKKGACPNCNHINSPKSKFCVKCGNSIKGKDKSSSRKRTSASKRKARYNKRKSKSKKKRKKHTDTTESEFSGGFDFKGIGDKMMK